MRHIAIIGSGIGGLSTGYLLSRYGDRVTILEHDVRPGGCLQSFTRNGVRFDTGFHFVGGIDPKGALYPFFKELGLLELPWVFLDGQEIHLGKESFILPCGEDKWFDYMVSRFPHEKEGLTEFLKVLRRVSSCPLMETMPFWEKGAYDWLCETIHDPLLRNVLVGSSMILELRKARVPLFAYAEIVHSFICSTARLTDGGQPVIDHLISGIRRGGGEVICQATVVQILEKDGHTTGVRLADGRTIEADAVVSSINPGDTMDLLSEHSAMRGVYRRRLKKLDCSMGCFTVNMQLRPNSIPLRNLPTYIHREGADIWDMDNDHVNNILLHYYPEQNALDFIYPLPWEKVSQWKDTTVGHRGEDYEQFKHNIIEQCLDLVSTVEPGIRDAILNVWSSTPVTWYNYLRSHDGAAYGVLKDYQSLETTILQPRTPLPGLYLTGQSMILHGIMGTTISAFQTAATVNPAIPNWPR